jgi:hypothetical protein
MSVGCDEGPWVWGGMVWEGWMGPTAIFSVSWSGGPGLIPARGCVRRSPLCLAPYRPNYQAQHSVSIHAASRS